MSVWALLLVFTKRTWRAYAPTISGMGVREGSGFSMPWARLDSGFRSRSFAVYDDDSVGHVPDPHRLAPRNSDMIVLRSLQMNSQFEVSRFYNQSFVHAQYCNLPVLSWGPGTITHEKNRADIADEVHRKLDAPIIESNQAVPNRNFILEGMW